VEQSHNDAGFESPDMLAQALVLSHQILSLAQTADSLQTLCEAVVPAIKSFCGCEAVGIRLSDSKGNIPYQAYEGFPRDFYESESPLSLHRDRCMCIEVIKGQFNPELSFFTAGGSFYMNGTTRFLAKVSEQDKGQTRNVCNQYGYESVALVPIRDNGSILGLIHVAGHQENCVPESMVRALETAALQMGLAIKRLRAEAARQQSEQRERALLNAMTSSAVLLDRDTTILAANETVARRLGTTVDALRGQCANDLVDPEVAEVRQIQINRVFETGQPVLFQDVRDGRAIEHRFYPVADSEGRVVCVAAYGRDITASKVAEAQQKDAQARLRYRLRFETLVAQLSTDFIHVTADHMDAQINRALRKVGEFMDVDRVYIFLYKDNNTLMDNTHEWCREGIAPFVNQLKNLPIHEFYCAREVLNRGKVFMVPEVAKLPPEAARDRAEFERQGIQSLVNLPLICGDAQIGFFGLDAVRSPREWSKDAVLLLQVIAQAIANAIARQRTEQAYRTLVDHSLQGFVIIQDNRLVFANQAYADILGYSLDEVFSMSSEQLWAISHPQERKTLQERLRQRSTGEEVVSHYETRALRKDGSLCWLEVFVSRIEYHNQPAVQVVCIDITERKNAEKRLIEYQTKLKALTTEMTSNEERLKRHIAEQLHDQVGQSLAFSKMKLQVLSQQAADPATTRELEQVCDTLTQIINHLRSLTFELSSPILSVLGLEKAISAWLRDEIEQEHGIKTEFYDDGQPKPLSDDIKNSLFRMVRELLVNAVKHADPELIRVTVGGRDGMIHIEVEDDGQGFCPEILESNTEDMGFGLFSIRERIEQLGGSMTLVSAPGDGCRVILKAPLAAGG